MAEEQADQPSPPNDLHDNRPEPVLKTSASADAPVSTPRRKTPKSRKPQYPPADQVCGERDVQGSGFLQSYLTSPM
eukprot:scaffold2019_cov316-Prasinococcus_capsulatus_cf.AAC.7